MSDVLQIETFDYYKDKQAAYWLWCLAGCNMPINAHFSAGDFDPKVGQTHLVFGVRDYKYLCASVTICVTHG